MISTHSIIRTKKNAVIPQKISKQALFVRLSRIGGDLGSYLRSLPSIAFRNS